MTPAPATPAAFEARLAAVQCRDDSPSIEQLQAEGWAVASEPSPWGSVWMTREVVEKKRG